ncbi:multicopper oxidase domain-containing protein [Paenibacillus sp. HJL G12]|uniref:Multicopper oxidase domain-containing protein n=1 Tax=Paenibacillus dendrobii TaxID=2691084 RepID=A0A7X3IIA4_9BACL|nr:multicopper oxidase family protein [Paenibacillus dendrobii]MWV43050.1 multicopper oxidase domain-containing protein [Paenibacillus dendrobii]
MKRIKSTFFVGGFVMSLLLAGCSNNEQAEKHGSHTSETAVAGAGITRTSLGTDKTGLLDGENAMLVAEESVLDVGEGKKLPVWTFNNSVPGPQIRVKQGETVQITVKNSLKVPVSLHMHGYPVPFGMDGIPGVSQNAIAPGKSFTYTFKATVPGTYWYHSHQDSVNHVDRGLYGSFVVESNEDVVDKDYTLMLDEWMSSGMPMEGLNDGGSSGAKQGTLDSEQHSEEMSDMEMGGMSMNDGSMSGMDMGSSGETAGSMGHDMSMYDLYTINGLTYPASQPLMVKEGDIVRLRLINAGYISHSLHLQGHRYRIVATDGNRVSDPEWIEDKLLAVAPGERYDIEFEANRSGTWLLDEHSNQKAAKNMRIGIQYENATKSDHRQLVDDSKQELDTVDMTAYGKASKGKFSISERYQLDYTMELGTGHRNGQMVYTINGKVYPDTDPVKVKTGDKVKVHFVNTSPNEDHPMHLHGHTFQVLSKNGQPLTGSPEFKDTLNVKPGEEYVVAFEANNPGDWMFHCHDLHHAAAGMVTELKYTDFNNTFKPDPNVGNIPE